MDESMSSAQSSRTSGVDFDQDALAQGILLLLKPAVDDIDQKVMYVRQSQVKLRECIDQLTSELLALSNAHKPSIDVEPYVKKLLTSRRRVMLVNSVLQNAQERLNKLQQNITRETMRKKALLESPST